MSCHAILLAGGSGYRLRARAPDKLLATIGRRSVFGHVFDTFSRSNLFAGLVVVFRDDAQRAALESAVEGTAGCPLTWVAGGSERMDSVWNGLQAVPGASRTVFIHDAARPLVSIDTLHQMAASARRHPAVVLAHRVTDTIKQLEPTRDDPPLTEARLHDLDRSTLWAMETPQVFDRGLIVEAYRLARARQIALTDDTAAVSLLGLGITVLESAAPNPKITRPGDLEWAELLLAGDGPPVQP